VGNTAPDLVNILPKAKGIVAQRGNTSGHLAIIAREFDVPLVIGYPWINPDY
jgi:phosphohistidine swiveling domain-containing protein